MDEKIKAKEICYDDELQKIRKETQMQMQKSRAIDYIAIVLALGSVFILWLLQWMGLY
jgi:hypothetical protein